MKNIFLLFKKDLIRFSNDKAAVMLTFLIPAVLIVIFGSIFGGGSGSRGKIPIIVVNESGVEIADFLVSEIDSSSSLRSVKTFTDENGIVTNISEEKAKELVQNGSYPAALVLPQNFFSDSSTSLNFKYYYDPRNEIESQLIQGTIQKTVFTKIPKILPLLMQKQAESFLGSSEADTFKTDIADLLSSKFGMDKDEIIKSMTTLDMAQLTQKDESDSSTSENFDIMNQLIKFDSQQLVGAEVKNPGVTRMVGGWAIMFLLFTLTGTASSIFEEKQEGTLKKNVLYANLTKSISFAKYLFAIVLGMIQLLVLFLFAYFLYDVDIFSNIFNLVFIAFVSASAAIAFGMVITAFAKSLAQANAISTLFILIMSALGGSWFPVTLFPDWMQIIAKFTLTYWSVEAFLQVLWRNTDFVSLLFPYVTILLGIAIAANYLALYLFKKRQVI